MTETVSHIALAKIHSGDLIYQVLPSVQIGVDERNSLWIKSPMSGTEKIQTNDVVELVSREEFKWIGRTDFVVNSGGIKLFPEMLEKKTESILREILAERDFFYFGAPDEKLGQKLVLYIESEPENTMAARILSQLQNILGKYEVPKEVRFISRFIRTPNGKINRVLTSKSI